MKSIGIICAKGFGDGLIFQIAAHNLQAKGYAVTTYSKALLGFAEWLPNARITPQVDARHAMKSHDALILQHDNSKSAYEIAALPIPVFRFFGEYNAKKHGPARPWDYVCNRKEPMAINLTNAVSRWFGPCNAENGLTAPQGVSFRKHPRRIVIHPSSSIETKNWPLDRFKEVAKQLQSVELEPFLVEEPFPTLDDLASFLYESGGFVGNDSGPGHLASYLQIPSVIVGPSKAHLTFWQPGWKKAKIVFPPWWASWIPGSKKAWGRWISPEKVTRTLRESILQTN